MLRLAKEVRLVGRDRVDEVLTLLGVGGREKVFAVLLDRVQLQLANTPKQPALNHRPLGIRHLDAELARYEFRESGKRLTGEFIGLRGCDYLHGGVPAALDPRRGVAAAHCLGRSLSPVEENRALTR